MIKLKKSVDNLVSYKVNPIRADIILNANESSFPIFDGYEFSKEELNTYPDTNGTILKEELASFYNVEPSNIILGNGSSDSINKIISSYCGEEDTLYSFTPSFSMYPIYTAFAGCKHVTKKIMDDFSFDVDSFIEDGLKVNPKVVLICTPNNPTGMSISNDDLIKVIESFQNSIILVDEAYIEFSDVKSIVSVINKYSNLIVARTMSKAFALAGLRIGCMIACEELIEYFSRVKIPYNINKATQTLATQALKQRSKFIEHTNSVKSIRQELLVILDDLKVNYFSTSTNFVLIKSDIDLYTNLLKHGILISKQSGLLEGYYRITVPCKIHYNALVKALKEVFK